MGFSQKQVSELRRSLDADCIHTREVQGRTLSYIEGWHAIAEANRIFGFDGWDRETVESKCVIGRDNRGSYHAVYVARIRITVRAKDRTVVREGYGSGEAFGASAGETHEKALKTAETDATKRALATFGKPFGLELYVSTRPTERISNPTPGAPPIPEADRRRTQQRVGRNGRYFVLRQARTVLDPALQDMTGNRPEITPDQLGGPDPGTDASFTPPDPGVTAPLQPLPEEPEGASAGLRPQGETSETASASLPLTVGQSLAPGLGQALPPAAREISLPALERPPEQGTQLGYEPKLLIDWPKRRREPDHLKFVRTQPCLLCGRAPSDAHHLRFAQARALGRKVSDEFTVPLCRVHHRQLHNSGKETDWWTAMDRDVDPLRIARGLWLESRQRLHTEEALHSDPGGAPSGQ